MSATSASIAALPGRGRARRTARASPPAALPLRFDDQVPTMRPSTMIVGRMMPPPGLIRFACSRAAAKSRLAVAEVVVVEGAEQADLRGAAAARRGPCELRQASSPPTRDLAQLARDPLEAGRQSRSGEPGPARQVALGRRRRRRAGSAAPARRATSSRRWRSGSPSQSALRTKVSSRPRSGPRQTPTSPMISPIRRYRVWTSAAPGPARRGGRYLARAAAGRRRRATARRSRE